MKKYVCDVCGYVYDPAAGDPDSGIAPGTAFEDLPADWVCPLCGVGKDQFSPHPHFSCFSVRSTSASLSNIRFLESYQTFWVTPFLILPYRCVLAFR